ncbi:N-6 DNA methylase (plasmid) [Paenibacillus peoriae]|uniref:N-6 DNA methylase n=1 Tax=Paenibacillus peoriae TaxID=59893 RepID=UPI0032AEA0F8
MNDIIKDTGMMYDVLRQSMNESAEIKNYVLPMMTLKYINENGDHNFSIPMNAEWERVTSNGLDFGKRMNVAFQELEEVNPSLHGVFTLIDFTRVLDPMSLFKVTDSILNRYSFERKSSDTTGVAIQFADRLWDISIDREGRRGGEITTPRCISKLMVQLINTLSGTIYDGTSGINGSLIAAHNYAVEHGGNVSLFGQEVNPQTRALGIMNLILHGLYTEHTHIHLGNTISDPGWMEEDGKLQKFDSILTAPPFSLSRWGYEAAEKDPYGRFRYGIPGKSHGDMAFVLHSLASLKKDGKAVIIIPPGVLFRGGSEGKIRESLIREGFIEAVIGLPANLFSGTGIPVAAIVLNKSKPNLLKDEVLIINAEEGFEKSSRVQNILRDIDIKRIVDTYHHHKEVEQYSRIVNIDEMMKNDWSLQPVRYLEKVDVVTKIGKIEINRKEYEQSELIMLKELADISRGYASSKEEADSKEFSHYLVNLVDVHDGIIQAEGLSKVNMDEKKAGDYELQPGDVLLSSRGTALKITVITQSDIKNKPLVFSQNFLRIRVNPNLCDPYFVKTFLESPIGQYYLAMYQKGTAVTVLSHKDVGVIPLPKLPIQQQYEIAEYTKKADRSYREAIETAERQKEENYLEGCRMMGISDTFQIIS